MLNIQHKRFRQELGETRAKLGVGPTAETYCKSQKEYSLFLNGYA